MASNYARGRYSEYKAIKHLEKDGFFWLTRSPASKGMFDVTGVGYKGSICLQTKRTKRQKIVPSMYRKDFAEIQAWVDSLESLPDSVRVEFWVQIDGKKGWVKYRFYQGKEPVVYEGAE